MSDLAIRGGTPVRAPDRSWPEWPVVTETDARRVARVTRSGRWSYDGPQEWKFAEAFTRFQGAKHGLCCANGTVGLQLALEALDIGAHDEVIVPGLTWQATAAACLDVNAVPILVDVEPDTWCIDVDAIAAAITARTRAVIVVHLYGSMPDMTAIQRLCKRHDLALIEDCAHQHGSTWKGRGVGSLGDVGSFSFQESKVLSSGEGGFNTCRTRRLFERLYSLRNCGRGWQDRPANRLQSGNYRITEWQAAILAGGLGRLESQVRRRERNALHLDARLAGIPGILPMRRRPEVTRQSYFNFAFRLDPETWGSVDNARFCRALNAELQMDAFEFERPYEPLNRCDLYRPLTKRRHQLNAEYARKIDPARFDLPVCRDAYESVGVVVHHAALLGTRKDMDDIAKAVAKLSQNRDRIP